MTGLGYFQPSVSGLESQSQALSVISGNLANVTTNGYKRSDTAFQSMVSQEYASDAAQGDGQGPLSIQADIGGVSATVLNRISEQGPLKATGRSLDLAVNGDGLFVFRQGFAATTGMVFGRNGQLSEAVGPEITIPGNGGLTTTANESFLVDQNGNYLQGWPVNADGTFPADLSSLGPVRVDPYAFVSEGKATTAATLDVNLPATDAVGRAESYNLDFINSVGDLHQASASFTKAAANTWDLQLTGQTGDQVSVTPTDPLTFSTAGELLSPASYSIAITHADGSTSAFSLDVSSSTQFAGPYYVRAYDYNGYTPGTLDGVAFDSQGYVTGRFSNGLTERLYRLPLASFANTDGLTPLDGNVYAASAASGAAVLQGAGDGGTGSLMAETLESSNVNLEDQFSRMIMTQQAYNSAATAFKTMDEIIQTAGELKR